MPWAVLELVMTGAGGMMVSVSDELPVSPELVALKVTANVPEFDGVPEMSPVVVLTPSPAGSPAASKLVRSEERRVGKEKLLPTMPWPLLELVMTGASELMVRGNEELPVAAELVA